VALVHRSYEAIASVREQLAAEAKAFITPGPRMVDEFECVLSVALAIVLGHLIGAQNISWAAFSGYMVMRGHVSESLRRGILRIIGTAGGAAIAVASFPLVTLSPFALAAALVIIGWCTLYAALTHRHAYAFLFVGLTFAMIVLGYPNSRSDLLDFASTRILEVFAGTTACVVVSTISTLTLRQRWPGERRPNLATNGWHADAARHAAQGAIALALLPLIHAVWPLPELGQAAVAIMAVMLVPVSRLGSSGLLPVSRRVALRVLGGACGACRSGSADRTGLRDHAHRRLVNWRNARQAY
jgi:Fusaric acid resistance protein family